MGSPNLGLFNVPTISDFAREEEEFNIRKQLAQAKLVSDASGGSRPAALQIADEYAKARAVGDVQRMNDIAIAAKSFDRGVIYDQMGNPVPMMGYGDAVGSIAGTKKAYEAQAQNMSDLQYDPQIAGGEAAARMSVELGNAQQLEQQKASGRLAGEVSGATQKKALQANDAIGYLDQAEALLPVASGGLGGTVVSGGKGLLGISDETTQANEELKLLSGWLVANVPRMEGPQSNFDVKNYQTMAADLGNTMKPIGDRLAARDD